jgi:hypothetical protein
MLWDLIQQCQISNRQQETDYLAARTRSTNERVLALAAELETTRAQLRRLTELLEARFGEDLNGDGRVGR